MTEIDRHDLYEHCVQAPHELVRVLRAIHGGAPRTLGEDFCGTAALSAAWVDAIDGGRAIAVDRDSEVAARARRRAAARAGAMTVLEGDVVADTEPAAHAADVIHCGNFSIGEWHARADLLRYLRHVHARLRPGGVFVCDLYGGETAFLLGETDRDHPLDVEEDDGRFVRYTWTQRTADPRTGLVENAIRFRVYPTVRARRPELDLPDAFVYRWRLWSIPELADALRDAGFARVDAHPRTPGAIDADTGDVLVRPLEAEDFEESWDVLVAARR